jgi:class 3 adenylate cyclase/putative methionine-R-sulfoxide reductase with GAF domain
LEALEAVPLRKDDQLLGFIGIFHREARSFTNQQIALLQNFAAQAVIAMENARLITETREALEQQTATAEVLQVINASPGDLGPVFDAMLEKATRLCGAAFGSLLMYDGEQFENVAVLNVPEAFAEFVKPGHSISFGPGTGPYRLLAGEEFVHIVDGREQEAYRRGDPAQRALIELAGATSWVTVALRKDDALMGAITVFRQEVQPFTDQQITLLQNFAAQAVIAMENARLLTETREALEQQTATAEVLGVINSSPGDLAPVFDAMLEKALHLCSSSFGFMADYDGEYVRVVAERGIPTKLAEFHREPYGVAIGTPMYRFLQGEEVFHIVDATNDLSKLSSRGQVYVDLGGARSFLAVPMWKDGGLLGCFLVFRQHVEAFSAKQIALLQNFAAQAVIAMENARLLGELRGRTHDLQEALEYQTATSDVLQVISRSTFDLQSVLDRLVETATTLCGTMRGMIAIRSGEVYRVMSTFGASPEFDQYLRQLTMVPGRGTITGRTLLERRPIQVEDYAKDPEYDLPDIRTHFEMAHTSLGVPLLREGESIGVVVLARDRIEPFTERQIELVRTFADQAVIAIENARLLDELRQRTEEVAELNRGLEARVAEQVDELGRVGRLKRFLAPQLAELIVSQGDERILESHRREIVVVFCDLRGYTAFTETAEPEEVLEFLRQYHGALGPLVSQFEGTLDQFSGDGIMVFFNDPVPCPDPAERAVKMAVAMREAAGELIAAWQIHGCELGFGVGIAQGFATLGQIGFSNRSGYTAIGTVCNLAARLCDEAKDGQILVSSRIAQAINSMARLDDLGNVELKGLRRPVAAFNVGDLMSGASARA